MKTALAAIVVIALLAGGYYYVTNQSKENAEEVDSMGKMSVKEAASFFITSANPGKGGDLGGLSGADAYCTQLAESAGLTGKTWHAYLSVAATETEPAVHARDRIGAGPWYNVLGEMIAANADELHGENNLSKSTAVTEKGDMVSGRGDDVNTHDILTGSNMDGTLAISEEGGDTTCMNWTSSSEGSAVVGHHDRVGIDDSAAMKSWNSSHASRGCSLENLRSTGGGGLFYCFAE